MRGLHETLLRYGLMLALFLDRGPGFISDDTTAVLAKLGVRLILGTAGYPEGHGLCAAAHSPCYVHHRNMCTFPGGPRVHKRPGAAVMHMI